MNDRVHVVFGLHPIGLGLELWLDTGNKPS